MLGEVPIVVSDGGGNGDGEEKEDDMEKFRREYKSGEELDLDC